MYCRVAATFRNVFKTLVLVETATSKALRLFCFMTREERCKLAIEKGYTYNSETGNVYNKFNKKLKGNSYIVFSIYVKYKRYNIYAHQFAWYYNYGYSVNEIDHINGIKNDNRICNLRSVTHQQNNWNRVNAKGYYYNKIAKKWHVQIQVNKKNIYLGLYNTEQEAHHVYLQAKEKYHKI